MAENLIATEPLFIGRARAANPGDVIDAQTVENNGWGDKVAKEGTKAAQQATTSTAEPTSTATAAKKS